MLSCIISNDLIKGQSETYIIISNMARVERDYNWLL